MGGRGDGEEERREKEKKRKKKIFFFFFKQKTAYEIYQCDWSSDVCSSDLGLIGKQRSGKTTVFNAVTRGHAHAGSFGGLEPSIGVVKQPDERLDRLCALLKQIGRASRRERV